MAKLHSIETMGLFDGPGIRTVFFLSGCPLRCLYCHNEDTQDPKNGRFITIEEIVNKAKRMKPYFKKNSGGVTFSGGEPLMSGEFLLDAIRAVKKEGIHVAIDTSGVGDGKFYDEIVRESDLILLDIKHYTNEGFKNITGCSIMPLIKFMKTISKYDTKVWLRHVMVPNFTDSREDVKNIIDFTTLIHKNVEKFEILPYHTMGIEKYEALNIEYKLKGVDEMDKFKAKEFEKYGRELLGFK